MVKHRKLGPTVAAVWLLVFLMVPSLTAAPGTSAYAFGTYGNAGQHTEHQKITRAALGCFTNGPRRLSRNECFDTRSLTALAGVGAPSVACALTRTDQCALGVGAVGNPDLWQYAGADAAHCDNADYLAPFFNNRRPYPHTLSDQRVNLVACIGYLQTRFQQSVSLSGALQYDGTVQTANASLPTNGNCLFGRGDAGATAKCSALLAFGRVLHGTEDFMSHSNWSDSPKPNALVSLSNPPGLAGGPRLGASTMLNLRRGVHPEFVSVPANFTTGCFSLSCAGRITHGTLNKDEGLISVGTSDGKVTTSMPSTPRGQIGVNFDRAVKAAALEAQAQWDDLRADLITTYGGSLGKLMACLLTHDDPTGCPSSGQVQFPTTIKGSLAGTLFSQYPFNLTFDMAQIPQQCSDVSCTYALGGAAGSITDTLDPRPDGTPCTSTVTVPPWAPASPSGSATISLVGNAYELSIGVTGTSIQDSSCSGPGHAYGAGGSATSSGDNWVPGQTGQSRSLQPASAGTMSVTFSY